MIMAVDVPKNRVRDHLNGGDIDDDDEDGPIVFKRGGRSAAKQSNVDSGVKKPLSSLNGNANGRSVNSQKGSSSSSKPSSVKSPIGSPNVSASSSKESPKLSPVANLKPPTASDNQHKQAPKQTALNTGRKDSVMKKETADDEDSDDDKPLSVRMKGNANGVNKDTPVKEENSDDDDDNKPISTSISNKPIVSSEKKSLVLKNQQNGSVSKDKQQKPSKLMLPTKRPIDKANSSQQSLAKKSKIEDKPAPVKAESKAEEEDGSDDDVPIAKRMKQSVTSASKSSSSNQRVNKVASRRVNKVASTSFRKTDKKKKQIKDSKYSESTAEQPGSTDGQKKWTTLVHNGVIFPPPYQPHGVKILYKGKPVDLTPAQEEVATMFAVMKDSDYMQKPKFLENFWDDWRKILGKNHVIQKLEDCDFTSIYDWYQREQEKKRQRSKEEKNASKEEKLKQEEKCMWAIVDGVKEKVGNFKVEPPALFRGRGEHPKMGKLKRRIRPSDITINIGEDAPIPECPIPGESWKEVKHDNTVTWLAFWNDPINTKEIKYVFLAASSSLKGQSDKEKYEKARKLKDYIEDIRVAYTKDFTNKDVMKQQIAVATYLIDKLALRAGNEKDDDEADTVGCCTLKVANVECVPPNKLKFDFLGKDSIRYENTLEVELPVYKAIRQFQVGKKQTDDLFDMLDTFKLNAHLKELMPGLTAKVFRTYNASITLDGKLFEETEDGLDVAEKVAVYSKANKEVAIICNHQRAISKSHEAQMMKLTEKIEEVKETLKELKTDLERAKKGKPPLNGSDGKRKRNPSPEAIQKKIVSTNQKIDKMELAMKTKDDLKTVALGTSKVNYLDPRITVAWCKRHEVPIEKMFNKSLLAKFAWAMDVDPQFRF